MSRLMRLPRSFLQRGASRTWTRSLYSFKDNPKMKQLKEKQAFFQRDDGVPIYLKGGTKDKILYRVTLGLLAIGLAMSLEFYIKQMNKV